MSGEFTDPLNDPRFPDRPNSPEFWRLVEVGLRHDGVSAEVGQAAIEQVIEQYIPYRDALYYARQRLGTAFGPSFEVLPSHLQAMITATWLDAFCKGAEFVSRTQQDPPGKE